MDNSQDATELKNHIRQGLKNVPWNVLEVKTRWKCKQLNVLILKCAGEIISSERSRPIGAHFFPHCGNSGNAVR